MTIPNSVFVAEADFWLKNYQGSSYLVVVISYFRENIDHMDKKVCTELCNYLIDIRLDVDDYWDNIKPLVDKAYSNGFISENTIQKQKDFMVEEFESKAKTSDYGKKKKIIEYLRIIEPSHKLIKRFEKEEKIFDFLKKSRLEKLEEEKESRIAEVKSDIDQQVEKRKRKARNHYDAGNIGCLGAVIGAVLIGAIIGAVITAITGAEFEGGILFGSIILGAISGSIFLIKIGKSTAAAQITITPAEEKDREKRIENIEKDIQNKITNLDNDIRKEIFKKTDE